MQQKDIVLITTDDNEVVGYFYDKDKRVTTISHDLEQNYQYQFANSTIKKIVKLNEKEKLLQQLVVKGRIPSKKNSKKIITVKGRPMIVSSKEHDEWFKAARHEVLSQKPKKGLTGVFVKIDLYAPDKRKGDLTNKAESIMDLLVSCAVIPDDNWFDVPRVEIVFKGVDKENPGAVVSIYKV